MSIFYRSIVKEYLVTWAVIFVGLLLIVFATQLVRYLGYAADGSIPSRSVLLLLSLGSIKNLPILCSLSIVLSVTLSLSRWYRDSEMVIWVSSGKSIASWVLPTLVFVTPIAILIAALSLYIAPWAKQRLDAERRALEVNDDISTLSSGVFHELNRGSTVFFADGLDSSGQTLSDIFIFDRNSDEVSVTTASRGWQEESKKGGNYLLVQDGYQYTEFNKSQEFQVTQFAKYGLRMDKVPSKETYVQLSGRSTMSLIEEASPHSYSELTARISLPFSAILLALISIPISFVNNRGGRSYSVAVGVLLFLFYKNVLGIVQTQVYQSSWSVWMGVILPHLVVLTVFILLLAIRTRAWRTFFVPMRAA
ncbi:MAG: LPS export ABC transporter permease LptF [Proteobacteria bacterium]|nr:LPS export ABC transporter permease LptF [Pseudomonadota bacterium]MDA1332065.1 LPS export ABC transporter permease LptF [Pseudomonadota bacterium]